MFFGEFEYRIDEKGGVPIPPRFRKELKEGVVLTPRIEKYITVYPLSERKKLAACITFVTVTRAKVRSRNRASVGSGCRLNCDV